ncbi:MAG: FadR/GntR family transcriptional regulator [Rhizomicrobium sp.]
MDQRTRPKAGGKKAGTKFHRRHLVLTTAAKLRDIILEREPGAQIGSLSDVSRLLGVGIVTVQQAARVLEHEGLLDVRRGPGGGYYGARPDDAALERSVAAYMRVHGPSYDEMLEMLSLLDCEIVPAAARCKDENLRAEARLLWDRIDACNTEESRIAFENDFRRQLFRMDARPLFELLMRVATRLYSTPPQPRVFPGEEGVVAWKAGKHRMLDAILKQDEALARFEAMRYREEVVMRLRKIEQNA